MKSYFLILLIIFSISVNCSSQTQDSSIIEILNIIIENDHFVNDFIGENKHYDIIIKNDGISSMSKINNLKNNISVYISNNSLLQESKLKYYYELIDFVNIDNTARVQLYDKTTNKIYSAYLEKENNLWKIQSTNIDEG